ncbi:MAG: hypothetical protein V3W44_10065 [Dehalococcoidales bacterium]
MPKIYTYTDDELLTHATRFAEVVQKYTTFLINDLKDSGLKLDFDHHWSWDPMLGCVEYANPRIKGRRIPGPSSKFAR